MTTINYEAAKVLRKDIDEIVAQQAKNAVAGVKVELTLMSATNSIVSDPSILKEALGASAYNTICAAALASMNTQLASIKTAKDTEFTALS